MRPVLSIVTPTRGNFSDYWLQQLLRVEGNVQFVMIYPPGVPVRSVADARVKTLVSPYRGEWMQRLIGLMNADGQYIVALDDDDYIHPQILPVVEAYFAKFPDSLVLRPMQERIDEHQIEAIKRPWEPIPAVEALTPADRRENNAAVLQTIPIAPLTVPFDKGYLIWPFRQRRDDQGPHLENFNTKIWRADVVQAVLADVAKTTEIFGIVTWIPRVAFDRFMGLFIQAHFFEANRVIGHWLPAPAQVRFISQNPALKPPRFHISSDMLLLKRFPQYGYFWNLVANKLAYLPRTYAKLLLWQRRKQDPLDREPPVK